MLTPEKLKKIRTDNNFSQEQLATIMGVHPNYISRLERGSQPISHKFEVKITQKGLYKVIEENIQTTWQKSLDLTDSEGEELLKILKENKPLLFLIIKAIGGDQRSMKAVKNLFNEV